MNNKNRAQQMTLAHESKTLRFNLANLIESASPKLLRRLVIGGCLLFWLVVGLFLFF
ncbi:hypothetical protein [Ruegeria sp. R14_0]|uniref:hypothetical protein n=1 Tax=Ruegeria sp. R14_0 TaxID=2821100 RepID=UPI001AD9857D|nr:hypothetical protein [Ruegeria sp. R14_0]MBO9446713.1 hypothetical protein [Ruegeria sp. R14_0]